jgi:hemoglobin
VSDDLPMLYDRVGPDFFSDLVVAFYDGIATDELLAPLYPDFPDFEPAKERLRLFLIQYWGGPTTYMETRGHPRLRMRHMPFRVGEAERDRWLVHMAAAIERVCEGRTDGPEVAAELLNYFVPAAEHLRNDDQLGLVE